MSRSFTTLRVVVPASAVSRTYRFVADLHDEALELNMPVQDAATLTEADVEDAYFGGSNNQPWRDILVELAIHPGEEVFWPDLCEAVNLTRKQASGVIGAGERRTKGKVGPLQEALPRRRHVVHDESGGRQDGPRARGGGLNARLR